MELVAVDRRFQETAPRKTQEDEMDIKKLLFKADLTPPPEPTPIEELGWEFEGLVGGGGPGVVVD